MAQPHDPPADAQQDARAGGSRAASITRLIARTPTGAKIQLPTRKARRAILARAARGEVVKDAKGEPIGADLLLAIAQRAGGRRR